jgi:hypothetical protein
MPLPPGHFGVGELAQAVGLSALCLLPGLLYLGWALPRAAAFSRELAAIEGQWLLAGSPDPVDSAFVALVSG